MQAEDTCILKLLGINLRHKSKQVKQLNICLRLSIIRALEKRTDNCSTVTAHSARHMSWFKETYI